MSEYHKYGEYGAEQSSRPDSARTAITFLLIGAGIGALVSLLFAPQSGLELRQSIGEQTSRLRRRTSEIAGQAREKVLPMRKMR